VEGNKEEKMNRNQRLILIVAAILFLIMVAFPPMARIGYTQDGAEIKWFEGYYFITTTLIEIPQDQYNAMNTEKEKITPDEKRYFKVSIYTVRLLLQFFAVGLATIGLYFAARTKPEAEDKGQVPETDSIEKPIDPALIFTDQKGPLKGMLGLDFRGDGMLSIRILTWCMFLGGGIMLLWQIWWIATGGGTIHSVLPMVFYAAAPIAGWGLMHLRKWAWFLALAFFIGPLLLGVLLVASGFMVEAIRTDEERPPVVATGAIIFCCAATGFWVLMRPKVRQRIWAPELTVAEDTISALERELQTAHDMQMGLMPTESPRIQGFDISGRCLPATHVGGDFFQYFPISDHRLAISLADVTGHAMEAAVPVMMFSGILDTQMETEDSLENIFARLNRSLHRNLDSRTFVCFTMGELDTSTRQFRLSNGGCPYPYHFQASTGKVAEIQVDAYPLGVRVEAIYPVIEMQLAPGDRVFFCSDGIIEAEDSEEEMFGFERTAETIRKGCQHDLSAPQLLDYLICEVKTFTGDTPQGDDQTVVILAVDS